MQLIQRMLAEKSDLPAGRQIIISAERRNFLKRRWRGEAADGAEFGFDLESRLVDGCVVFHENGNDYVVRQQLELVYEVAFESPDHASLVGWKVGNLHLPAQILPHTIRVLHDEAMKQLLERENWKFTEPTVLFTPMKAVAHAP